MNKPVSRPLTQKQNGPTLNFLGAPPATSHRRNLWSPDLGCPHGGMFPCLLSPFSNHFPKIQSPTKVMLPSNCAVSRNKAVQYQNPITVYPRQQPEVSGGNKIPPCHVAAICPTLGNPTLHLLP